MNALVTAIFDVFTAVGDWIVDVLTQMIPVFYDSQTGLTFLGTLAVVALGMSVIFLVIGIIQSFLHFRG